ncbi:hypothetical protein QZH41_002955 [Actinostola sp. cb2023]|nr:hypothetical protein QZH41_002955 [Actinostola sp. cb2023]
MTYWSPYDVIWGLSKSFPLPLVVQVEDGFYDENDDTTLSHGDVLTLHLRKKLRSYKATGRQGQEINIPVSIEAKVQAVLRKEPRMYHNVEELVKDGVEEVEWVYDTPWLCVKKGDVLQVHDIVDNKGIKCVRMSFVSKPQSDIFVQLDYHTTIKAVPKRTLWLTEVEHHFNFPITIKFIDESLQIKPENTEHSTHLATIADLGEVTLQGVEETEVFIASIECEDRIVVMKIPITMDISLRAGIGIEEEDYTYVDVCEKYNKRARLDQLDDRNLDSIRIGDTEATVERIYELPSVDEDDEDGHDYEFPAPAIPTREGREPYRQPKPSDDETSEEEQESDEYEEVDPALVQPPQREPYRQPRRVDGTSEEELQSAEESPQPPQRHESLKKKQSNPLGKRFKKLFASGQPAQTYAVPKSPRRNTLPELKKDVQDFDIPKDLQCLSEEGVCECLKILNLGSHIKTFQEQQINGSLLVSLTPEMLVSLGVAQAVYQYYTYKVICRLVIVREIVRKVSSSVKRLRKNTETGIEPVTSWILVRLSGHRWSRFDAKARLPFKVAQGTVKGTILLKKTQEA